jgi:hypothetical protein
VAPSYGALVVIEDGPLVLYSVVSACVTQADSAVYAVRAYQKTEEELRSDQPHVFALLHTIVTGLIVGFTTTQDSEMQYRSTAVPARLHAFVRLATDHEWALFAHNTRCLAMLFNQAAQVNLDELLLAFMCELKRHVSVPEGYLIELLHAYTLWTGNDYRRMRVFAQRLEQL